MTHEFFTPPNSSAELAAQAEAMIATAVDPVERGSMLLAAIEEGVAISPAEIISNSATIEEIHVQESIHDVSADKMGLQLKTKAIKAYAAAGRFAEADEIVASLRSNATGAYFNGICELLKHGYAGPDEVYAHINIEELRGMAKVDVQEDALDYEGPERQLRSERLRQLTFMQNYLESLGGYGVDVLQTDSEHGGLLAVIHYDSETVGYPNSYQTTLYNLGGQYAAGGNLELARQCMQSLAHPVRRAELGFDILERTDSSSLSMPKLSRELSVLMGEIEESFILHDSSQKITVHEFMKLQVRRTKLMMQHGYDATPLLEPMSESHELRRFLDIQLDFHLSLYRQTGNAEAREIALAYLSQMQFPATEIAARHIRDIAEADLVHGYIRLGADTSDEQLPIVCLELDQVFWGDRKFMAQMTGAGADELERFQGYLLVDEERSTELVYGPHSAAYGDYIDHDIQTSRETRDRSYAALVSFLGERGMIDNAARLIENIETPAEQVRARFALARILSQADTAG